MVIVINMACIFYQIILLSFKPVKFLELMRINLLIIDKFNIFKPTIDSSFRAVIISRCVIKTPFSTNAFLRGHATLTGNHAVL